MCVLAASCGAEVRFDELPCRASQGCTEPPCPEGARCSQSCSGRCKPFDCEHSENYGPCTPFDCKNSVDCKKHGLCSVAKCYLPYEPGQLLSKYTTKCGIGGDADCEGSEDCGLRGLCVVRKGIGETECGMYTACVERSVVSSSDIGISHD